MSTFKGSRNYIEGYMSEHMKCSVNFSDLSSLLVSSCRSTGRSSTASSHSPSPHNETQIWRNLQERSSIHQLEVVHTRIFLWGITTVICLVNPCFSFISKSRGLDNLAKALACFPNRLMVFLAIRLVSLKCICHLCRFQQFFYIMPPKLISMMYIVLVKQTPVLGWRYSVPMFCFDPVFELFKVTIWNFFTLK